MTMIYVSKWKTPTTTDYSSMKHETEAGAELWLFKRLSEGAEEVQIEDEAGRVLVSDSEMRSRWKSKGRM